MICYRGFFVYLRRLHILCCYWSFRVIFRNVLFYITRISTFFISDRRFFSLDLCFLDLFCCNLILVAIKIFYFLNRFFFFGWRLLQEISPHFFFLPNLFGPSSCIWFLSRYICKQYTWFARIDSTMISRLRGVKFI